MVSVAFFGESLHLAVFVVAHSISQYGEEYTAFTLLFNQLFKFLVKAARADNGITPVAQRYN